MSLFDIDCEFFFGKSFDESSYWSEIFVIDCCFCLVYNDIFNFFYFMFIIFLFLNLM